MNLAKPLNQLNTVSVSCAKCKKKFDSDETMNSYKNKFYHAKCFMCNFCDKSLAGLQFYTKPDNSLQCQECYDYHIPRCFVCEQQIPPGVKYSVYQGKHFHKTCFKCIKWYVRSMPH